MPATLNITTHLIGILHLVILEAEGRHEVVSAKHPVRSVPHHREYRLHIR